MFKAKERKKEPKKRRARGTGSFFRDKKTGRWIGRKIIGRKPDGSPRYVERSGVSQADVVAALEKAAPPGPGATVAQWAEQWLRSLSVRESTLANYTICVRKHIVPAIGGQRVASLTPSQAATFLKSLAKTPDGDGLAPSTVSIIRTAGKALFEAARLDGLIASNPFAMTKRPKLKQKEINPFTAAEVKRIVAELADTPTGPIIALLAAVGCRVGEAGGLDVSDWNARAGTISITKSYSRKFGLGPPKTARGVRTITVPNLARPGIVKAIGDRKDGPLFVTGAGRRFVKQVVQRALARCLKRLKLAPRTPHELRHTVATLQIARGVPLPDIAKFLGDSVTTLTTTYLHPTGKDPGKEMNAIFA